MKEYVRISRKYVAPKDVEYLFAGGRWCSYRTLKSLKDRNLYYALINSDNDRTITYAPNSDALRATQGYTIFEAADCLAQSKLREFDWAPQAETAITINQALTRLQDKLTRTLKSQNYYIYLPPRVLGGT